MFLNGSYYVSIGISKNNSIPNSWVCVLLLKVYFRKGKVLHDAGFLGDALQLFLQCLVLDEDFAPAKLEVEKILCDLLSPENLKEGLKDSSWSSLPCIKNKPFQ